MSYKDISIDDKIKELKNEIEVLDLWMTIGIENGIFSDGSKQCCCDNENHRYNQPNNPSCDCKIEIPCSLDKALGDLKCVWDKLYKESGNKDDKGNIIGECETKLSAVLEFYSKKVKCLGIWRRFYMIYGGHILAYLLGLLVFTAYVTLVHYQRLAYIYPITLDPNYGLILYNSTILGFVAGIMRSIYNLINEARLKVFRRASWSEYVAAPFIAGLLAFVITLSMISGLESIQPVQQQQQQQQQQQKTPYALYLFAFASGLFWHNALNRIRKILGEEPRLEEREGRLLSRLDRVD